MPGLVTIDAAHARRFLLARHALSPPRALPPGEDSVVAVVGRFGSLQVDPLATTGLRNHDLVLAARIEGYRTEWLDSLLHGPNRRLIEVYNKSLGIVPLAELAYHRASFRGVARAIAEQGGAYHEAVRRYGPAILRRLAREGPLSSRELAAAGEKVKAGWGTEREARAALYVLFRTGRIATVRREGNQRFYDRIERVLPPAILDAKIDEATALRHRLLSRYRAVGLLGLRANPEVFVGTTTAGERAKIVGDLVAERALVPVQIKGITGTRYLLASELPLLESAAPSKGVGLLAPLDPLMWDRTLVRELFGLDYKWQVYTPAAKRVGGYYDLPITFGDRIVGLIEPRFSRESGVLEIARVDLSAPAPRGFTFALKEAVAAHAASVGASEVVWPT